MNLKRFRLGVVVGVFSMGASIASALQAASPPLGGQQTNTSAIPKPTDWRPNVLFIMCDQFNVNMLGHEGNGWGGLTQSMTPRLDQLASEGVRFSDASCSSASCQPSRNSILTGRWIFHHGVRENQIWESRKETTFPELARAAGYKTINVGLHHLMWDNQLTGWGDDHGFDKILDFGNYSSYCISNGQMSYSQAGNIWVMPGLPVYGEFENTGYSLNGNDFHPTGYFADEVIKFLNERAGPQGDGEPFVCWYSMRTPHTPILPSGVAPDDYAHMYHPYSQLSLPPNYGKVATTQRLNFGQNQFAGLSDDQMKEALSYYYGSITQLDFNIGRVLDKLDELDLSDETLVVFTADHGDMAAEMRCWTKGTGSYKPTTRVPLIMRLPGILPAGRSIDELATNLDFFPTLVEATGVPISESVREAVDGHSLLALMTEPTTPAGWPQEAYHTLGWAENGASRTTSIRTKTSKYIFDELDGSQEFYDLAGDPYEITNLFSSKDPGIQAQITDLKGRMALWWNNEIGHAPKYKIIGAWGALPARAENPVPASGSVEVPRDVDPSWLPSTGAAVQNVYLGTTPQSMTLFKTLDHMESSFNAGTLEPATTYYWAVEQVNGNGSAVNARWSFTTTSGGTGGPGLATSASPAHRSSGVALGSTLAWTVSVATQTQDIYFGVAGQMQLVSAGLPATTTTWDPGPLSAGVAYEWRVDTLDANGLTQGDVWTFEVSPAGLAKRAVLVSPAHFQVGQSGPGTDTALHWKAGEGAVSHNVHFGTSFPLTLQNGQSAEAWNAGPLVPGQTYYWRIDEVNSSGVTTGWTWRFTR